MRVILARVSDLSRGRLWIVPLHEKNQLLANLTSEIPRFGAVGSTEVIRSRHIVVEQNETFADADNLDISQDTAPRIKQAARLGNDRVIGGR